MGTIKLYIWNFLGWIDCGLNVFFGGSYMETCSSRLGRHCETSKAACIAADAVDRLAFYLAGEMIAAIQYARNY